MAALKGYTKPYPYGSIAEQNFHQEHPSIAHIHNKLLKENQRIIRFNDPNDEKFTAMADFYHYPSKTIIEFKDATLNQHRSRYDCYLAQNGLKRGFQYNFNDWSNSLEKHLIVQSYMEALGFNYLLIFSFNSYISTRHTRLLTRKGINWIHQRNFEFYCDHVMPDEDWNMPTLDTLQD